MKVIIVGNNAAGTTAAKGTRDASQEAEIEIFTEEPVPYYPRPKLIDFIAGAIDEKDILFNPVDWYEKNRLTLHLSSRVDRVDVASKKVLVGADWHTYDRLVLANGSSAFLPPFKGLPKENVFTLRTLDDAKRIRKAAAGSKRVVVIVGGLLGLETARALATGFPGLDITILE